jgi:HD-like signal output (HDOD) protein
LNESFRSWSVAARVPRAVNWRAWSAVTDGVGHPAEDLYDESADAVQDRRSAQRAARSLAASVAKLHGTVAMPVAAQRLLAATETDDFELGDVIRILETDPALTGRLIRQVNAAIAGGAGCSSITQAVTLLGVRRLRTTALTASALELFAQDEEPVAKSVAMHAARTGTLARILAPHCGLAPDEMYACGLLHDIGKLMLLRGADLDYRELLTADDAETEIHLEERKRYGFDHAALAGHVLASWKLPHPLPRVVAWHHQPSRAYRGQGKFPRMVALLRLADGLSSLERSATPAQLAIAFESMPEELAVLGFSDDVRPRLCSELLGEAFDRVIVEPPVSAVVAIVAAAEPAEPEPAQAAPPPPPEAILAPATVDQEVASVAPTSRESWATSTLSATRLFIAGAIFGRLSFVPLPTFPRFVAGLLWAFALLWLLAALQRRLALARR